MRRLIVLVGLLGLIGAAVKSTVPDISRYIKMRNM